MINQIVSGIITNAPLWIWPLLLALIMIGLHSTRTRVTYIPLYCLLPLTGILALKGMFDIPNPTVAWISCGLFFLVGCYSGYRWQQSLTIRRVDKVRAVIKGEWVTLITLMIIFFSNFIDGAITATAPDLKILTSYILIFSAVIGLCKGIFVGRTLQVLYVK
ncbi:MAG: hypothetical protein ACRBCI_13980 [Cellvibrionaceae bacterium]